jgi:hypothetical protein
MEMSPPTSEANGEGNEIIFIFFLSAGREIVCSPKGKKNKRDGIACAKLFGWDCYPPPLARRVLNKTKSRGKIVRYRIRYSI